MHVNESGEVPAPSELMDAIYQKKCSLCPKNMLSINEQNEILEYILYKTLFVQNESPLSRNRIYNLHIKEIKKEKNQIYLTARIACFRKNRKEPTCHTWTGNTCGPCMTVFGDCPEYLQED